MTTSIKPDVFSMGVTFLVVANPQRFEEGVLQNLGYDKRFYFAGGISFDKIQSLIWGGDGNGGMLAKDPANRFELGYSLFTT